MNPVAGLKMLTACTCSILSSFPTACQAARATAQCSSTPTLWSHTMRTGMNLLLWTGHVTEEHFPLLAKLKAAGFDGVELPLCGGDAVHYRKVRKELDNLGLACTAVTVCNQENNPIDPEAG